MGVLRDRNGRIIGTTDEPGRGSVALFVCPRSAAVRVREGCQPKGMGALDAKTKFACPKSQERRFGLGCERRHALSTSERKIAAEDAALRKGKTMSTRRYAPIARDVAVPLEGWRGDGTMSARILNACRMDDFSAEELAEVEKLLGAVGIEPDMASDARPRMGLDAHTERARRHMHECVDVRFANVAAGRYRFEDLYKHPFSPPPPTKAQTQAFDEMFPGARARLG